MRNVVLEAVPKELIEIEDELASARKSTTDNTPPKRDSWIHIARAAVKSRSLQRMAVDRWIHASKAPDYALVRFLDRRSRLSTALSAVAEVWDDTKRFLRYSPRVVQTTELPYTKKRLTAVRQLVATERRWLEKTIEPPAAEEHAAFRVERGAPERGPRGASLGRVDETPLIASAEEVVLVPGNLAGIRDVSTRTTMQLIDAPEYLRTRRYRVWFATNRAVGNKNGFQARVAGSLTLGTCTIYVPRTHGFGSLGSSWLTRLYRRMAKRKEDDRLKLERTDVLDPHAFVTGLSEELSKWAVRSALVVVHGYNVSFEEAALRTAQIGFDLRIDGVTAFFSWPSHGKVLPYTQDEEAVQIAEPHFIGKRQLTAALTS